MTGRRRRMGSFLKAGKARARTTSTRRRRTSWPTPRARSPQPCEPRAPARARRPCSCSWAGAHGGGLTSQRRASRAPWRRKRASGCTPARWLRWRSFHPAAAPVLSRTSSSWCASALAWCAWRAEMAPRRATRSSTRRRWALMPPCGAHSPSALTRWGCSSALTRPPNCVQDLLHARVAAARVSAAHPAPHGCLQGRGAAKGLPV